MRSLLLEFCIDFVSNSLLTAFIILSESITLVEGSDTFIHARLKEVVRSAPSLSHASQTVSVYLVLCLELLDYQRLLVDNAKRGYADMQRRVYNIIIGCLIHWLNIRPATSPTKTFLILAINLRRRLQDPNCRLVNRFINESKFPWYAILYKYSDFEVYTFTQL